MAMHHQHHLHPKMHYLVLPHLVAASPVILKNHA